MGARHFGSENVAIVRTRGVAAKQGFRYYYFYSDAIGTKVSVRYRRSGRLSGVVVKMGSTVLFILYTCVHKSTIKHRSQYKSI